MWEAAGKVLFEFLYLHLLLVGVVVVVWHYRLHERVLLSHHGLFGLVDGKVELCYERLVHPRLAHVVSEFLSLRVAWQKPYYQQDTHYNEQCPYHHIAPVAVVVSVYYAHPFLSVYVFTLRKYEKKSQKSRKYINFAEKFISSLYKDV